jgi:hypothetical protein
MPDLGCSALGRRTYHQVRQWHVYNVRKPIHSRRNMSVTAWSHLAVRAMWPRFVCNSLLFWFVFIMTTIQTRSKLIQLHKASLLTTMGTLTWNFIETIVFPNELHLIKNNYSWLRRPTQTICKAKHTVKCGRHFKGCDSQTQFLDVSLALPQTVKCLYLRVNFLKLKIISNVILLSTISYKKDGNLKWFHRRWPTKHAQLWTNAKYEHGHLK